MKKNKNKNKNFVFWITGLSGSGKTILAKKIHSFISKSYGPTICIHGDTLRKIFKIKSYEKKERLDTGKKYINLIDLLISQKFNVIISVVGLFKELQDINRKKFENYIEIFIKSDLKILKKKKIRKFYSNKTKNVWGVDLKPEFPKKPDITILNNFKKNINELVRELKFKIKKKVNENK